MTRIEVVEGDIKGLDVDAIARESSSGRPNARTYNIDLVQGAPRQPS
jgi:hypothetical protein